MSGLSVISHPEIVHVLDTSGIQVPLADLDDQLKPFLASFYSYKESKAYLALEPDLPASTETRIQYRELMRAYESVRIALQYALLKIDVRQVVSQLVSFLPTDDFGYTFPRFPVRVLAIGKSPLDVVWGEVVSDFPSIAPLEMLKEVHAKDPLGPQVVQMRAGTLFTTMEDGRFVYDKTRCTERVHFARF